MDEKRKKRQLVYKLIMLFILTIAITFMITTVVMYTKFEEVFAQTGNLSETGSKDSTLATTLQAFKQILSSKYIGELDEEEMLDGALKGYVEALGDPYTEYLTKDEMDSFIEESNSEYVGIGIYVSNIDNQIEIVGVMNGTPAEKAGLIAGDIITKVDGVSYTGSQLTEATNVLKSTEGTIAKVTILRDNKEQELEITRSKITIEHVASTMLDDNIAYIAITSFDSGVKESFEKQLKQLLDDGADKIIIDIRNNGGGIVDEATGIADLFVEKNKTLLITEDKNGNSEEVKSTSTQLVKDLPVVVLVNQASASASEILAGALKDQANATIVGKTTYGKGVIQTLYQLTDGSGLKITSYEYFTPDHTTINNVGIVPDVEVDLTAEDVSNSIDTQLQKAIEVVKK